MSTPFGSFQRLVSDVAALREENRELRAELAKLWDAHNNLARRASDAILAHMRFGG